MEKKPKRTKEIKLRLTPDEHKRLSTLAGETPLAEWVREYALEAAQSDIYAHIAKQERKLKEKQKKAERLTVAPELLRQLAGIGNNVNQIARTLNASNTDNALDLARVALALEGIVSELERIKRDHHHDG